MDKKEVKQIQITKMIINNLRSTADITDEWRVSCDIDFFLSETFSFEVFEKTYTIDRVKMLDYYGDEIIFRYANDNDFFHDFTVSKSFIHKIYKMVEKEQCEGALKAWEFRDIIMEILKDEDHE